MAECIVLKGGGGADLDVVTAGKPDVLAGKVIVDKDGEPLTGTMPDRGAISTLLGINSTYTIPEGYHNGLGKVTQNIATMGGQTVNPTASQQTVSSNGKYMTGNVVVNGVSNLIAANIKKGVNVGGTIGTFQGYVATATDLYLRGNNIVELTVNSNYESLDSGQLTVKDDTNHTAIVSMTTNLTGFTRLNIEGYKSNAAAGNMYLIYGGSQVAEVLSIPTGNYTVYFNVTNFQVSGSFQLRLAIMKGSIYRIWKS